MDAVMERRVTVATGWASTRIAVLDSEKRYEDSYCIAQEFREWITCIGENQDMLEASIQAVPRISKRLLQLRRDVANDTQT